MPCLLQKENNENKQERNKNCKHSDALIFFTAAVKHSAWANHKKCLFPVRGWLKCFIPGRPEKKFFVTSSLSLR